MVRPPGRRPVVWSRPVWTWRGHEGNIHKTIGGTRSSKNTTDVEKHYWSWKPLSWVNIIIKELDHDCLCLRKTRYTYANSLIPSGLYHAVYVLTPSHQFRLVASYVAKKRRGSPCLPAATRECLGFWSIRCHCLHSQQPQYLFQQWIAMAWAALHSGFAGCILTAHQTWQRENPTIYVDEFPSE